MPGRHDRASSTQKAIVRIFLVSYKYLLFVSEKEEDEGRGEANGKEDVSANPSMGASSSYRFTTFGGLGNTN